MISIPQKEAPTQFPPAKFSLFSKIPLPLPMGKRTQKAAAGRAEPRPGGGCHWVKRMSWLMQVWNRRLISSWLCAPCPKIHIILVITASSVMS